MDRSIRIGYVVVGRERYAVYLPYSPTLGEIQDQQNEPVQVGVLGGNGWRPSFEENSEFQLEGVPSMLRSYYTEVMEAAEARDSVHKERYTDGTIYYMDEEDMHFCGMDYYDAQNMTDMENPRYMMPNEQVILPASITQSLESERDVVDTLNGRYSVNRDNNNHFKLQTCVDATTEVGVTAINIFQRLTETGIDAYIQVEPSVEGEDCLLMKQIIVLSLDLTADNTRENLINITMEYEYTHSSDVPALSAIAQRSLSTLTSSAAYTTEQLETMQTQLRSLVAQYTQLVEDVTTLKNQLVELVLSGNIGGGVCEASTAAIGTANAQTIASELLI